MTSKTTSEPTSEPTSKTTSEPNSHIRVFSSVGRLIHGRGSISLLGEEVRRLGAKRALVVTDPGVVAAGAHLAALESLSAAGALGGLFADVELEPSPESIEAAAEAVKAAGADLIVGLGGGSSLDSAKGAALLAAHGPPLERFLGVGKVPPGCPPVILVPTTAGTGSEATPIVVVKDQATGSKRGLASERLLARAAILDPVLTVSLPPFYTVITGLDALVHALESYVNKSATPVTEALCLRAMDLVVANIRRARADGGDLEAREAMLCASYMAGCAFANTQTGVIHALGLGVPLEHHLPHGLLMAALCPMGMAYNHAAAPAKFAKVASILGVEGPGDDETLAAASVGAMESLILELGVTPGLAAHGVGRESIPSIVAKTFADERLTLKNPRPFDQESLRELLESRF
jgi:alcohol dehydrogenase class IV